jgi:N-acetylmuramoyl-L-alanine amidase
METYVMNARASDRYAAEVAARENAVTSNSMGEFGSILEEILVDMQKTNKVNESSKLAASVQGSMHKDMAKKYSRIKNLGVKKAPFYVLIGANMPSILVETGFISNYKEEKRLRSSKYLKNLSAAMAKGISGYAKAVKRGSNI